MSTTTQQQDSPNANETENEGINGLEDQLKNPHTVLHWYDFLCPFCYVGQQRTAILVRHELDVIELPFQAHPEIPLAGVVVGPRNGPMYTLLERETKEAGLALDWPLRLPNTRRALAAAEWVRQHEPDEFPQFHKDLFTAHFALAEDLGDPAVLDRYAANLGINVEGLHAALSDGSAFAAVKQAETVGRRFGVQGTPAWLIERQLVSGLRPAREFELLAEAVMQQRR